MLVINLCLNVFKKICILFVLLLLCSKIYFNELFYVKNSFLGYKYDEHINYV